MLKIDKESKKLVSLSRLRSVPLSQEHDLPRLILNSREEFVGEIGEELFLIDEDIWPPEATPVMRPDILAIDKQGVTVAILLPDKTGQAQTARAITSVGMLANRKPSDLLDSLSEAGRQSLQTFLGMSVSEINRQQRAILVAETCDDAVLAAAKWLREKAGLGIRCVQAAIGADADNTEYLSCTDVSQQKLPADRLLGLNPAEVEAATSAGSAGQNGAPGRPAEERRKQQRSRRYDTQHLQLGFAGQMLTVSKLIDLTDGGLGAEILNPLPVGSRVTVAGDLHGSESAVKLEGRARVAHCGSGENGAFRIGLLFEEISCRNLY